MNDPTTNTANPATVASPDAPDTTYLERATDPRSGWLWVSAGVLAALTIVQGSGLLDRPAYADMASDTSGYTIMTTDGGTDEIVVLIDDRQETLMVYRHQNRERLQLLDREPLPELFTRARAAAGLPPRP